MTRTILSLSTALLLIVHSPTLCFSQWNSQAGILTTDQSVSIGPNNPNAILKAQNGIQVGLSGNNYLNFLIKADNSILAFQPTTIGGSGHASSWVRFRSITDGTAWGTTDHFRHDINLAVDGGLTIGDDRAPYGAMHIKAGYSDGRGNSVTEPGYEGTTRFFAEKLPQSHGITDHLFYFTHNKVGGKVGRAHVAVDGYLMVGTTNAQAALTVNGKGVFKEVQVTTNGFPDYVFADGYKLMSLSEIDDYIKIKGHLPGMRSAAEVEENGLELGDFAIKLLEKIEELTLHLIELQKENEELQTAFNKLSK